MSRFRGPVGSERARQHAFQQLGLADRALEDEFHEMEYEEVPDVTENCAELLPVEARHLVDYGRFVRDEDFFLSKHGPRSERCGLCVKGIGMCVKLFLLDNLALVLLLMRGSTRSSLVLTVMRRRHGIAYRANYLFFSMGAV